MKHHTIALIVAATTATFMTANASAVYLGLQISGQHITLQNGTVMMQYRVYASFSDPNDYLIAGSGSPTLGNLVIQSRNADDTDFGGNFYNPPGGAAKAPSLAAIALNPDVGHDTFVTIGVSIAEQGSGIPPDPPDETRLSPGFTGFGIVTDFNSNNAGWFAKGAQRLAGYLGDGDPLLRVLMMQLTVSNTSNVRGTVVVSGVNNIPLGGGQSFNAVAQTFNSIPGPGALALLGLALMTQRCTRRR